MHYVIAGAGPAAVAAAEHIKELDPSSKVTMIGAQPQPPYSRMAIPYYLTGKVKEEGTYLRRSATHYEEKGIDFVHGEVVGLDGSGHTVSLADGQTIGYDKLLLATGAEPIIPPVPGMDDPRVQQCWHLEDAERIIDLAKPGARAVQVGAGFIGCIILESWVLREVNLTVVEMGPRMVPRMLGEKAGGLLQTWCESKGVTVHTNTRVKAIESSSEELNVVLENGETCPADVVIVSTGVKPRIHYLEGTGITVDQGIVVDQHMQTTVADVYAAGDCAQGLDFSTGETAVHAVQPTATEHGRVAAANMVGNNALPYKGSLNMNILDTLGLVTCSFGAWEGVEGGDSGEMYNENNFQYINLQFKDDVLVGANSVGYHEHLGVLRGLIETKIPLGPWKERLKKNPVQLADAYVGVNQSELKVS
ncbi:MAG: NAD(P)/FAD-dependent oxidoreductase [Gammaproteobacteria bacterium]|nr:NAD(P)/FAD-dependent oxidoreductase [Gammaproteobacteria bacterium]